MSKLYLSCPMGISGDMFCGALIGLTEDKNKTIEELNGINFNGVVLTYQSEDDENNIGHFSVLIDGKEESEHHHGVHAHSIFNTIDLLNLDNKIKSDAKNVYNLLLDAESKAHEMPVEKVHLHEVGNTDAICDIVCACYLMNKLGLQKLYSSSINTGFGKVMTAHGELDVPAPATKILLEGLKNHKGETESELCTPTGAAIVKYFIEDFSDEIPFDAVRKSAGCGKKKFDKPNRLYAYWGE